MIYSSSKSIDISPLTKIILPLIGCSIWEDFQVKQDIEEVPSQSKNESVLVLLSTESTKPLTSTSSILGESLLKWCVINSNESLEYKWWNTIFWIPKFNEGFETVQKEGSNHWFIFILKQLKIFIITLKISLKGNKLITKGNTFPNLM